MSRFVGAAKGRTPAETISKASSFFEGRVAPGPVAKPASKRMNNYRSAKAPPRPVDATPAPAEEAS